MTKKFDTKILNHSTNYTTEKRFVREIGERLGLPSHTVEEEIGAILTEPPLLPSDEVLRFVLLDDLINLSVVDGQVRKEEVAFCKETATMLGFEASVVEAIMDKIQTHLEEGFWGNQLQAIIKDELFRLTNKNEKYR